MKTCYLSLMNALIFYYKKTYQNNYYDICKEFEYANSKRLPDGDLPDSDLTLVNR